MAPNPATKYATHTWVDIATFCDNRKRTPISSTVKPTASQRAGRLSCFSVAGAVTSATAPHLGQNLVLSSRGAPHFVQNLAVVDIDVRGRVSRFAGKEFRFIRAELRIIPDDAVGLRINRCEPWTGLSMGLMGSVSIGGVNLFYRVNLSVASLSFSRFGSSFYQT